MATRTVGIDLGIRGPHVATMVDGEGHPIGAPVRFRLVAAELRQLVQQVRHGLAADDQVVVVLEPTGMAWLPLARWLGRAGCTVIRVKGQRVKALRRYLSEHAKTDLRDAELLGQIPRFGVQGLRPLYVRSAPQHALNRLTKQRLRYQEEMCSIRRRLLDLIRWAQPALERALPDLQTTVALAVLEQYFDPQRLHRLGPRRLEGSLREHVGGNHPGHGSFIEALAQRLLEAAEATLALHGRDDVDFGRLQLEVDQEITLLRMHRTHMVALEREIETLYTALHTPAVLRTLPGIGNTLGPSLFAVLHTWQRFGSQRRLRGFCGLFPTRNESGGVDRPGQSITQGGHNRLKRDLILAADVARTVDPELAAVYYRCMVEKGHHHRQALCAVATRLINRLHAVWKSGRPYVLRDLQGQPLTVPEAKALIAATLCVPDVVRRTRRRNPAPAA